MDHNQPHHQHPHHYSSGYFHHPNHHYPREPPTRAATYPSARLPSLIYHRMDSKRETPEYASPSSYNSPSQYPSPLDDGRSPRESAWDYHSTSSRHATPAYESHQVPVTMSTYPQYRSTRDWSSSSPRDPYPDSNVRADPPNRPPGPGPSDQTISVPHEEPHPPLVQASGSAGTSRPRRGLWALNDAPNNNQAHPGYSIKVCSHRLVIFEIDSHHLLLSIDADGECDQR